MLLVDDLKVALDSDSGVVKAIDGLRLSMQRGETFALVGESGCGKSMTALALMRLLPESGSITQGSYEVEGVDMLALPESRMREVRGGRIGMIFQEPSTSLNPVMRIGDQIVEAIEAHTPLRGAAARAKALDWLQRVGIPEPERRIDDYPFRISGGQKQRVMIAMTLAADPEYLIADEPTTALDVTIQAQVLDLLKSLQAEKRLGLMLITHDLGVVAGMAHRVALMYAGQIIEVAPAEEFFADPKHPYARALLQAVPDAARRGQSLAAIPGTVPPLTQEFTGCRFAPRCDRVMPHCAVRLPELWPQERGTRSVRCWLYAPEATAGVQASLAAAAMLESPTPTPTPLRDSAVQTPARSQAGGEVLLDVRNLRVRFPIRRSLLQRAPRFFTAVDGISLQIRAGETLALVGESGCGKTTAGKAVVQLLRRLAVIEGEALLDGTDLFSLEGAALQKARQDIQIVFQDPYASLNPRMRVFDIIEEGLIALQPQLGPDERRTRLEALTEQVGLRRDALQRYPHEFSGGQRQRIAIARALAVQPRLLVCDEPTSALDVSVQAQILNLLRQLQRDTGLSYLFITHNIGVVEYIAERVVVMKSGAVVEQGTTDQILNRPTHPYTQALLDAVPRIAPAHSAA